MNQNDQDNFNNLPKFLKEKIWSYLDKKELFKLRLINKNWKHNIENPKSSSLKEDYNECKTLSEEFIKGKKFWQQRHIMVRKKTKNTKI
jgi:hypothetical protein